MEPKYVSLAVVFSLLWSMATAQNDSADFEKRHQQYLTEHPYWTVWFTTIKYSNEFIAHYDSTKCIRCDSIKYHPRMEWVQSIDDSTSAYEYYRHLKSTRNVTIWHRFECEIDPATVYIDKYDMVLRKYVGIKQP